VLSEADALQRLITALKTRGYVEDTPVHPSDHDNRSVRLLRPRPPEEIGAVWLADFDARGWFVGIALGGAAVYPADHVRSVMDGRSSDEVVSLPPLEEQAATTLSVVDRLRTDHLAKQRAIAALGPKPEDLRLGPRGNDPCWCGSGKKLKRCHGRLLEG
jgi:SEC-C motif